MSKVLIANRGEIAIRIARSCRKLGLSPVAVYSSVDRESEHVRACDLAYEIGPAESKESYLNIERVLDAAKKSGATFVHPGYGFLSERAAFVEACEARGLTFVGPTAESMRVMGDKIAARQTVDRLGVPRVPGSPGAIQSAQEAKAFAQKVGYPVLLKAAAGGGGKGMRRVESDSEIDSAFEGASREALSAFGDGSLYVEKWILKPHHVEIQVFGDGKGGAIHLGERECSIQRRHQKIWEEAPAPILDRFPKTREKMRESALVLTQGIKYRGAGTLEFIVDEAGNYYFLEMNTRLQVEHPVTEWITGVDLVEAQLRLAQGKWKPEPVEFRGVALEVRIYAEDPETFLPAPGPLGLIHWPSGPFVRVDTAFSHGEVSRHYDPMIAKISVWGRDRTETIARLRVALGECRILPPSGRDGMRVGGLRTNLPLLRKLAENPAVINGETPTDLIPNFPELTQSVSEPSVSAAIAAAIFELCRPEVERRGRESSAWARRAREESLR